MSDIRDALHASLDEAETQLIRTGEQLGGTLWRALQLLVQAIRKRDHEIEQRLKMLEMSALLSERETP